MSADASASSAAGVRGVAGSGVAPVGEDQDHAVIERTAPGVAFPVRVALKGARLRLPLCAGQARARTAS